MDGVYLLIGTFIIIAIIIITITIFLVQKRRSNKLKKEIEQLDIEKNKIMSAPITSELSKVEAVMKNEKLGEKYKEWQQRFKIIKDERLNEINDMIIDLDLCSNMKDYKNINLKLTKTEIEVFKARESVDELLDEIKEVTSSEEKYRGIVTKLKNKYRNFVNEFRLHQSDYEDMTPIIELQLENIEKRFQDFDKYMENNEYDEVVHIVKALDNMIDHMDIIIKEIPSLMLLSKKLIPKRIEEIEEIYKDMTEKGYYLEYLKIEYNINEIRKHIEDILSRIKVLNLEDCMFELKTILDYLDSTFNDFENEKLARKLYEENINIFEKKLKKSNKIVKDIYLQLDDIMSLYHLKEKDIKDLDKVKLKMEELTLEYKDVKENTEKKAYSKLVKNIELLSLKLKDAEEELDDSLKNLGSMYDDELRAREQLEEIQGLLKECKVRIRRYKLPIIENKYFIELNEANEAINEIIKELDKKPIMIKTLNTRVDTARDLVLKLLNTTTTMIDNAKKAEEAIVYGNRYRFKYSDLDRALTMAENLFYKGEYKESMEISINSIYEIDENIKKVVNN